MKTELEKFVEMKRNEQEEIAKELLKMDIDQNLKTLLKQTFPNIEY